MIIEDMAIESIMESAGEAAWEALKEGYAHCSVTHKRAGVTYTIEIFCEEISSNA
ncbi:MAG: hypothetical protein FWE57_11460 [Chitinispirillia bacterium]|nr:hypothetical protein [Chitinispirillia bacterium]